MSKQSFKPDNEPIHKITVNGVDFMPPKMSWEEPIELEILAYVRRMKQQWASQRSIWRHVNEAAKSYVSAYETVEKHIVREIEMRKSL